MVNGGQRMKEDRRFGIDRRARFAGGPRVIRLDFKKIFGTIIPNFGIGIFLPRITRIRIGEKL